MLTQLNPTDEDELRAVLDIDALSGEAWYRLGVHYHSSSETTDALGSFLASALIDRWNLDAWCSALGICFSDEDLVPMSQTILEAAYEATGERLIEALASWAAAQPDGFPTHEFVNTLAAVLEQTRTRRSRDSRVLRLHGPDHRCEIIDLQAPEDDADC